MDFSQQRLQQQDSARQLMYQNPGYQFERNNKKTLILRQDITANTTEFTIKLFEPFKIDKLSDIYLESFTTIHNTNGVPSSNIVSSAFVFNINEFNINNNSSDQSTFNKLVIPNELPTIVVKGTRTIHKSKKLNFICSINPSTLTTISGSVTGLDGGSSMFTEGDAFLMELLIIDRY